MSTIWAYSRNVPGRTCADARLLSEPTNLHYPSGNDRGQAGWDIGLMFGDIPDLADKIREATAAQAASCARSNRRADPVSRLAINVHGDPGKIDADGTGAVYDFDALWRKYSSAIRTINNALSPGASVLIMGCNVARGDAGAKFLMDASSTAFPGHQVVGFTTIGETMRQFRSGGQCSEPGMRDTPYESPSEGSSAMKAEREKELLTLPWASETSPHAKIALNGKIIKGAEQSVAAVDYSVDKYLPGSWSVAIGGWNGYFVFGANHTVYWTAAGTGRHGGKWSAVGNRVTWSFDDDAKDFKRDFQVATPLKTTIDGTVTIKSRNSGFFVMSKQS